MAKVSREVAQDEFSRWAQYMDFETEHSDPDLRSAFEKNRSLMIKGICSGKVLVSEKGNEVTLVTEGEDILFREPTGATLSAMNKVMNRQNSEIAGLYAAMAEVTHTSPKVFAEMNLKDCKYANAVGSLMLGE